jgi:ribosomal peptide maturation radical SAM protein 1
MTPRVAFVSMPWAPVSEPSLGLALLKQQLSDEGVEARVFHFSLGLLRHLTGHAYQQIASCWGLNEFVFTGVLDDHWSEDQVNCMMERCVANTRFDEDLAFPNATELGEALLELRHEIVPQYLAECAEEVFAYAPTLVGFSCMFDQTLASIALAKVLRQRLPGVMIVCGGYALEGPPGLEVLHGFDVIDAVAVGDGEPQIGKLAKASVGTLALDAIGGVLTRAAPFGPKREKVAMDASPDPDFSDWFADLVIAKARDRITINTTVLPVESSRGCWWGQKHHCVFCGIDEDTLSYRSKAPERVLAMLARMRERYGTEYPLRFSDYILPHAYSKTVLPALAEITPRYVLQCEIKANQTEEKIAQFARAGFSELQPGIESFDSNVLRLMDKGVTGMQNVYLLKLGYNYGIQINYNILYGIPGERTEWYQAMVRKIPRLFHLTPPVTRTETIFKIRADAGRTLAIRRHAEAQAPPLLRRAVLGGVPQDAQLLARQLRVLLRPVLRLRPRSVTLLLDAPARDRPLEAPASPARSCIDLGACRRFAADLRYSRVEEEARVAARRGPRCLLSLRRRAQDPRGVATGGRLRRRAVPERLGAPGGAAPRLDRGSAGARPRGIDGSDREAPRDAMAPLLGRCVHVDDVVRTARDRLRRPYPAPTAAVEGLLSTFLIT